VVFNTVASVADQ